MKTTSNTTVHIPQESPDVAWSALLLQLRTSSFVLDNQYVHHLINGMVTEKASSVSDIEMREPLVS